MNNKCKIQDISPEVNPEMFLTETSSLYVKLFKKITYFFITPILLFYFFRKYGGIWGFKSYINKFNPCKPLDKFMINLYESYFSKFGSWIAYNSQFNGIPCFPHGAFGIFISGGSKIGKNVIIFQHVTIGSNTLNNSNKIGSPKIGDNVYIGSGAKIIGGIVIGNNCRIGANAVVYTDLPPNSVAVQSSTRIIQKENLDNRYYTFSNGKWLFYKDGKWFEDKMKKI